MIFSNLLIYIISFVLIWLGSGLIVASVDHFSKRLKLSTFAISFLILGNLTSIPEFSVGLSAIADHDPDIFIGNLLGGIPILFLLIIPLLAIFGKGINLKHDLDRYSLLACLAVVLCPSLLLLDNNLTMSEGMVLVILYFVLVILIERRHGIFTKDNEALFDARKYSMKDFLKVILGLVIVYFSSQQIVDKTVYFSDFFNIPEFYISLLLLSLGTNMPELSIAMRSILSGNTDVAFGDYLGSAANNTMLFGIFTLLNGGEISPIGTFIPLFIIIALSLGVFYLFALSGNKITRKEGFILLGCYGIFLLYQILL